MLEVPQTGVMTFHARSAEQIATERLPGRCALLQIADDEGLIPEVLDKSNVAMRCDVIFADAEQNYGGVSAPDSRHARTILQFADEAQAAGLEYFVAQCQAGVGRSVAVCGALARLKGGDFKLAPTYNRRLYRQILAAGGQQPPAEPLVSITVRVKYGPEKLWAFLLSLRAQRYDNWECIAYTDGRNYHAHNVLDRLNDERIRLIETPKRKGRWGHPYRQMAFEQCRGEWVGTQNDDNYLTPGYIEQLVNYGEESAADLVVCQSLHRYFAWDTAAPGGDLSTWLCRRSLLSQYRWTGDGFTADRDFLETLRFGAGDNVAIVNRPLVVKN